MTAQKFGLYLLCFFLILGNFLISPASAYAQNQNGDYFKGKIPVYPSQPDYVISTWRVITSNGLNCRTDAGIEFGVTKTLPSGKSFQVQVSVGREQHNNPTKLDSRGLPWFKVVSSSRSSQGVIECFVRANSRYIEPVIPS